MTFFYGLLHMGALVSADQLCVDTGCDLEDLQAVMNDRDRWWESENYTLSVWLDDDDDDDDDIELYIYIYIYIYIYVLGTKGNTYSSFHSPRITISIRISVIL